MGNLIYAAITSLDGFVADESANEQRFHKGVVHLAYRINGSTER